MLALCCQKARQMTSPSQPVQFVLLNLHSPWDVMQYKEYHYDGMPGEALSGFLQGKLQDKKRRLSQKVTPVTQMRKSVTRRSLCPMNFPVTLCIIRHISLGKRGDTGENRAQGNRMENPAHLPAFFFAFCLSQFGSSRTRTHLPGC